MPNSAIAAGVVDIVAQAMALPGRIIDVERHTRHELTSSLAPANLLNTLDKIVVLLRDRSGNDFSLYKNNTLHRRIERRMAVHQIISLDDYLRHLRANPSELVLLFKELLIGVTSFFRDPEVWKWLTTEAIPALLAGHPTGATLRAWVPACSTGEEAYSLAMAFMDALALSKPTARFSLHIYATDLDPDAIDRARKGVYPDNISADMSAECLARYFTPLEGGGYQIHRDVREMIVFATHNIISDPPFTKLDILSCRNLLIYFGAQLQKRLLPIFHYSLNPGGLLLLGNAETIGNHEHLFKPLNARARLFQRFDEPVRVGDLTFPDMATTTLPPSSATTMNNEDLGHLTDQLIQQSFSPAAVLVNGNGDILYISGRTGKYLEPAAGKTNVNIHVMAREGLREALVGMIFKALKDPQPILLKGLQVGTNGGTHRVDVTVQGIEKPEPLRGRVLIVFKDVPTPPARRKLSKRDTSDTQNAWLQELEQTREALQITREEMQTTVEELQSLNEELQTVNAELQSKVEDLTWVRNDMTNLLNSTEIASVFLDNEMRVRRFSNHATEIFKLIPGDVGRPLSDIVTDLNYPTLKVDALEVLRTLIFQQKEVTTHDGRWFRVRIMPYRTQDNVINGVVITFIDITEIKQLEARLRQHGAS